MRPSIRFEVFKRDGFTCLYCGRRSPDVVLEVDHVLAQAKGGTDELDNLVTSCGDCNRGKSDRPLDQRAPMLDPKARAEQLAEREQQIAEYSRWRAAQRDREDGEITALAEAFGRIPRTSFLVAGEGHRWFWDPVSVRKFVQRLGYHDVLDAVEATSAKASRLCFGLGDGWGDRDAALAIWKYFCGCCWGKIKDRP